MLQHHARRDEVFLATCRPVFGHGGTWAMSLPSALRQRRYFVDAHNALSARQDGEEIADQAVIGD